MKGCGDEIIPSVKIQPQRSADGKIQANPGCAEGPAVAANRNVRLGIFRWSFPVDSLVHHKHISFANLVRCVMLFEACYVEIEGKQTHIQKTKRKRLH